MLSVFKIFTLFGIVSGWAEKALADNKITLNEAADLVTKLGPVLGIKVDLDVSTLSLNPADLTDEEIEGVGQLPHKTEA